MKWSETNVRNMESMISIITTTDILHINYVDISPDSYGWKR